MTFLSYQPVKVPYPETLSAQVGMQMRILGALILRELHTRFGRHNIGYLWMFAEPMMLSMAITAVHYAVHAKTAAGMEIAPFYLCGYTPFLMFRSIVNRATQTIESNRSLMYHRQVTIFNLLLARALLDAAGVTLAMFVLLGLSAAVGLGGLPARPHLIFAGLALMFWICFSMSLPICALSEVSKAAENLVHPITYIMMPLSGVFFIAEVVPWPYRDWLLWFPLIHIIQLIREGQFGGFDSHLIDIPYVISWCLCLSTIGLLAIRAIRPHMEVD